MCVDAQKLVEHLKELILDLRHSLAHEIESSKEEEKRTYRQVYTVIAMIEYEADVIHLIVTRHCEVNNNLLAKLAIPRINMIFKFLAVAQEKLEDTKYNDLVKELNMQMLKFIRSLMEVGASG